MIYTDWFPPWINPVRVGVYQSPGPEGYTFSYWDGSYWYHWANTPNDAYNEYSDGKTNCGRLSTAFSKSWRGLTSEWKWIA